MRVSVIFGYEDTANKWQSKARELDAYHEINRGDSGFSNFLYGLGELVDPTLLIGGPAIKGLQAGTKVVNALSKNAAKTAAYGAGINASLTALDQDKSKEQVMQSVALGGVLGGVLGGSAPLVVNKIKTGSFLPKDTSTTPNAAHINTTQDVHTSSTTTQGTNTPHISTISTPHMPNPASAPNINPNLLKDEQLAQNIYNAFLKKEANAPQNINDIALNYVKENHPKVYDSVTQKIQGDNFVTDLSSPPQIDFTRSFNVPDYVKNTANINPDAPIVGDMEFLFNKHREMFKKPSDAFRLIQQVLDHPTYFYPNNNPHVALMGKKLDNGKLGKLGIEKNHPSGVNTIKHLTQINNAIKQNEKLLNRGKNYPLVESAPPSTQPLSPDGSRSRPGANAHSKDIKDDDIISMLNKPLNSIESNKRSLAFDYLKKHYPSLITKTDLASGSLGGSANVFLGDENDSVAERFAKGFAAGLAGSKGVKNAPALYQYAKNSLNDFQTLAKENPQLFTRMLHKQALKEDFSHFIGTKALDIKPNNLITAKALKEKGISDELIFENTGWFIGKDNNWRFELSLDKSHVYKLKE